VLLSAHSVLAQSEPGATSCTARAYLTDPDPKGTNVRSAPRADAPVAVRLSPRTDIGAELVGADFDIIGSKNGWLLIRNVTDGNGAATFAGPGWIWGGLAAVQIADSVLRTAPRAGAPVAARIENAAHEIDPSLSNVLRVTGCDGKWVQVAVADKSGKQILGWVEYSCASQLTTCDIDRSRSPASFDCAQAKTRAEKMVCGNVDLASLDQSLATEFMVALDLLPRKQSFRNQESEWLASTRDRAPTVDAMINAYSARANALHNLINHLSELRMSVEASKAGNECIPVRAPK
jgi:hypothetical protein